MTPRIRLMLTCAAALFVLGAITTFQLSRPLLEHQRAVADKAEAQAKIAIATTRVVERAAAVEKHVNQQAEVAADVVEYAPGADAPLPPAVLDAWRAGIGELRAGPGPHGDSHP